MAFYHRDDEPPYDEYDDTICFECGKKLDDSNTEEYSINGFCSIECENKSVAE